MEEECIGALGVANAQYRSFFYNTEAWGSTQRVSARLYVWAIMKAVRSVESKWNTSVAELAIPGSVPVGRFGLSRHLKRSVSEAIEGTERELRVSSRLRILMGLAWSNIDHYSGVIQSDSSAPQSDKVEALGLGTEIRAVIGRVSASSAALEAQLSRLLSVVQVNLANTIQLLTYLLIGVTLLAGIVALVQLVSGPSAVPEHVRCFAERSGGYFCVGVG